MDERQKIIAGMAVIYDGFTPQRVLFYTDLLSDIPVDVLKAAVREAVQTIKFVPKVAEIREIAGKIMEADKEQGAGASWKRVIVGMSRWGSRRFEEFRNELEKEHDAKTALAISRFGWESLGQTDPERLDVARAQYMKIYAEVEREFSNIKLKEKVKNALPFADRIGRLEKMGNPMLDAGTKEGGGKNGVEG